MNKLYRQKVFRRCLHLSSNVLALLIVAALSAVILLLVQVNTGALARSTQETQSKGTLSGKSLYTTASPNRVYRVEISQKWDSAGYERYVYLNAYRSGEPFVRNKLLYTGDLLDSDFRDLYPDYSWVSNSVIKIGRDLEEIQSSDLRITNETQSRINYLLIETYRDKYILFDVEPEAVIHLRFQFIGQLSCQGEFADPPQRFGSAVELIDGEERTVKGEFSIRINEEEGPIIESQSLKLRRVTCCAADRPDIHHENY